MMLYQFLILDFTLSLVRHLVSLIIVDPVSALVGVVWLRFDCSRNTHVLWRAQAASSQSHSVIFALCVCACSRLGWRAFSCSRGLHYGHYVRHRGRRDSRSDRRREQRAERECGRACAIHRASAPAPAALATIRRTRRTRPPAYPLATGGAPHASCTSAKFVFYCRRFCSWRLLIAKH